MKTIMKILTGVLTGVLFASSAQAAAITVGGKNFTEQFLLGAMTAQLLKAKGYKVDRREGMGSQVVRNAQINGQIDVYWEYTGTSLITYNKINERLSPAETYRKVKELDAAKGITWLNPSGANNTYALAVRTGDAKTDGLTTLSDLAAAYNAKKNLTMAVNAEFMRRSDGLPGLKKAYGFKVRRANIKAMDAGLTYKALREDLVDVALVFATDGRIKAFNFRVLKDDKGFFPNYAVAPVVRTEVLKANPQLAEQLNALSAKINNKVLRRLNAEVDVEKKPVEAVAGAFLKSSGLL
jgi:osmoprotectant transport system substrate-binding protein